ncbi:MAG: ammonium transporter [Lachnospiraceae bacterium]|nr:ammonium transporter [Lachnospiraceae bacterium]
MSNEIAAYINENLYGIWFLIGAALVFWMQAGFALVEAGFTRAKNAGNIIMKNLMDFCIGTVMFILIGCSLLLGEDLLGFIGKPGFDLFTAYEDFNYSSFVFNLVFCATTATIVSGAMAERTKFLSYCVYSAVISALIYPVEAHWIWGGGWLANLGFHDFAGSCAIHMVGGISALIGAKILGPRIGKFSTRTGRPHAIPGHNLPIGALGVFILWLGWYGFNGAAATSLEDLGSIFLTTTVAPAIATMVCMIFTWIKYGKPDVSMCLNASLAGLVAITASCDVTDAAGAIVIGAVAGVLVVFGVWLLDYKLKIDDPVGAVAVHMMNGLWGTLAVGLFATESAPGYAIAFDGGGIKAPGLFYGGGVEQLGLQCVGVFTVGVWTAVTISITFIVIKVIFGLRVTPEEELMGLDSTEHGLPSAYADFMPAGDMFYSRGTSIDVLKGNIPMNQAVEVVNVSERATKAEVVSASKTSAERIGSGADAAGGMPKYTKVSIVCQQSKFEVLKEALNEIGVNGITVTQVLGCGAQKGITTKYRGAELEVVLLPKMKVEVVVSAVPVEQVVETARKALYTGNIGDGKIFLYDVENVVKVRTGEEGYQALQDAN